jgi:hypothetical protein
VRVRAPTANGAALQSRAPERAEGTASARLCGTAFQARKEGLHAVGTAAEAPRARAATMGTTHRERHNSGMHEARRALLRFTPGAKTLSVAVHRQFERPRKR